MHTMETKSQKEDGMHAVDVVYREVWWHAVMEESEQA